MMLGRIGMTRDERQAIVISKYKASGTLLAATGFGKTYTTLKLIMTSLKKSKENNFIIVVPTINLKLQWEYEIQKNNIINTEVYVINTACTLDLECTLLVLDEIHMYGGEIFSNVFTKIKYKFILGLTATLEPNTKIYDLVNKYCPVFDEVTLEECRNNNWVVNYKVYNLAVKFTKEELSEYNKIEYLYRKAEYALGGRFNAFDNANYQIKVSGPKRKEAFMYLMAVKKRRNILINASNKLVAIREIRKKFKSHKTLVFCESIDFATLVNKSISKSTIYHSKLTPKVKSQSLTDFKDGTINTMIAVKSLNAGVDIPDCSLGIVASGNSKVIDDIQRVGRVIRSSDNKKEAIFINLYIPKTQDEVWLKKRQLHQIVIPIMSVDDIL
jgi:superfamily II DNA or RNA helicase